MSDFKKMMKALDKPVKGMPTVDQVRARFIGYETEVSHCAGWIDGVSDEYGTAFDRWLEQVKAEAWEEGSKYTFDELEYDADAHAIEQWGILAFNPYRKETRSESLH